MTRTMSAGDLRNYIQQQRASIGKAYQEVEQIQVEYQGSYTRFKANHDKQLQALVSRLEVQPGSLPPSLRAQVDARAPVEGKAIADRLAELNGKLIPAAQKGADDLVRRGQQDTATLRDANPRLNAREEALKSQLAGQQKQLDDLNAQIKGLSSGLGFIFNAFKIHDLDRTRMKIVGRMDTLSADLRNVRQEWVDLSAKMSKDQADLRTLWQTAMAELGQLEQERDYLAADPDALARHRALLYVLDGLKTPVADSPDGLSGDLKQMIALNIATDDFQAALGSVAGILGVAKGVDEGLNRFGASVDAIIDEQNRHSEFLSPVRVQVPDGVVAFGANWDALADKARDEKKLADHPADFVAAMKPFLEKVFTKDQITAYFNALGAALTQATAGWRSK